MQDNHGIHTEEVYAKPFLEKFPNVFDWPARSPDLNPIENLWSYLSYRVLNRKYENLRQLKAVIYEEYEQIPESMIQSLCRSFPERLTKCIEMKGQLIS